jgi:hypothetical protein
MFYEFARTLLLFAAPGYLLSSCDRRLGGAERLCVTPLASTMLYGTIALAFHLLGFHPGALSMFAAAFAVAAAIAVSLKARLASGINRQLLIVLVFAILLRLAVFSLQPEPHSGDSALHFLYAKSFLSQRWYTADVVENYWTSHTELPFPGSYRPPLEDFLHSIGMSFNSADFPSAASMTLLFGLSLVVAVYALATRMFDGRVGILSAALVSSNFYLISRSVELEPRVFVSFFIVTAVHFSLRGRGFWPYASASAALAYLTHYTAVWFIMPVAAYHLIAARRSFDLRIALASVVLFLLVISPWLGRNYLLYGDPMYTTSRYAPLLSRWDDYNRLTPPTFGSYLGALGGAPAGYVKAAAYRIINMATSYVPAPQKILQYGVVWTLGTSLINLVGPIAFAAALAFIASTFKDTRRTPMFFTVAVSSLGAPLTLGYPQSDGLSGAAMNPLVPFFLIYCAAFLAARKSNTLLALVASAVLLQGVILSTAWAAPHNEAGTLDWIRENTPQDSVFMSAEQIGITYGSGRSGYITPYESWDLILQTAKDHNVKYYVLTPVDARMRDVSPEKLSAAGSLVFESNQTSVYRLNS